MCVDLFDVRSTLVLQHWHVEDPGHSAKSAGGRLHLNAHTTLTQRSREWAGIVWESIRKRAHTELIMEQSGHGLLSSLSHCGLILEEWNQCAGPNLHFKKKKKKKTDAGNDWSNSLPKPRRRVKGHHHHHVQECFCRNGRFEVSLCGSQDVIIQLLTNLS